MEINKNHKLRDVVYKHVRDEIISFKLEPGTRLLEEEIARVLGVSRTPVREAFAALSVEGFIEVFPRRGAVVKEATMKDLTDTLIVREELEILAIRLAIPNINDDILKVLKQAKVDFEVAVENKETSKMIEADTRFHDIIFGCTKNEKLIKILKDLKEQLHRYRAIYIREKASLTEIIKDHTAIYESLKDKNSENAKKAISDHINNQKESLKKQFKQKKK